MSFVGEYQVRDRHFSSALIVQTLDLLSFLFELMELLKGMKWTCWPRKSHRSIWTKSSLVTIIRISSPLKLNGSVGRVNWLMFSTNVLLRGRGRSWHNRNILTGTALDPAHSHTVWSEKNWNAVMSKSKFEVMYEVEFMDGFFSSIEIYGSLLAAGPTLMDREMFFYLLHQGQNTIPK